MTTPGKSRSLDEQREEFKRQRFLAMPLAGMLVWAVVGIGGVFLPLRTEAWLLLIGTGSIAYIGMGLSKLTGEDFLSKTRPKNTFDTLFMLTVAMSLLVFSIALPWFMVDPTSLPLSVGVLTGLMWLPITWMIQHWIGVFHGVTRTVLILAAWFALPEQRFIVIPAIIVVIYAITIVVLERRWRAMNLVGQDLSVSRQ